jgi:Flp pilus assembly protein TadG
MIRFNPIFRSKVVAEDRGAAIVEFAIVAPILLVILLGIFQFGINMNQYVMLTNATAAGARLFSISRAAAAPRSTSVTLIEASAPTLKPASITFTFSVNGTACGADGSCSTALAAVPGGSATVATSYPCMIQVLWFLPPGCTLTAQSTERIE